MGTPRKTFGPLKWREFLSWSLRPDVAVAELEDGRVVRQFHSRGVSRTRARFPSIDFEGGNV